MKSIRSIRSIEDYLAAIWQLKEDYKKKGKKKNGENTPIRIKDIAQRLKISSPSVSEYVRKLAKYNKLDVIDRKGVILTPEGEREAVIIINKHKIIECFLTQVLGIDKKKAHDQTHDLEHVMSLETIEKLYKFITEYRNCNLKNCPFDSLCIPPSEQTELIQQKIT